MKDENMLANRDPSKSLKLWTKAQDEHNSSKNGIKFPNLKYENTLKGYISKYLQPRYL